MKNLVKYIIPSAIIAVIMAATIANASFTPVIQGGTGVQSLTPYAIVTGGTTQTAQVQQLAIGSATQVLTSNGAGALPTWQYGQSLNSLLPSQSGKNGYFLSSDGTNTLWATVSGSGTVTSVTAGSGLSGGTITTSGTLTLNLGSANVFTSAQSANIASLAGTTADGFFLQNSTAAANGTQQVSPALHWGGFGWGTTGGTSQDVSFRSFVLPAQSTVPTGTWKLQSSIAGGAYADQFTVTNTGVTTATGGFVSGTATSIVAFQSNSTFGNSDFATLSTGSSTAASASLLFGGASTINYRAFFNGVSTTTLGANNSYTNLIIGSAPITAAATGTHALLANMVVNPLGTVTNGSSVPITATATLYVNGAGSGGTSNYALDVGSGNSIFNGNITLGTAGNKINITSGANASIGTATLSGGTVTVSTTAVTASSKIFLTDATTGTLTNVGSPTVGTIVAGTSFVINSTNVLDASNINWLIIN